MANLVTQEVDVNGTVMVHGAANAGGDKFVPGEDVYLSIKNAAGAGRTVTVVTPKEAFPGAAIADIAIVTANGDHVMAGPFPANRFGNPADAGKAALTYSSEAGLTIAACKLAAS